MGRNSTHEDDLTDRRLRAIGIRDRENWDIEACDDKSYTAYNIVVRPDWVLKRKYTGEHIIVSFKSREIECNEHPSECEAIQVSIEGIVLKKYLETVHGMAPTIGLVVLYNNKEKRAIVYDKDDEKAILKTAAALYKKVQKPVPGTKLAQLLSGADFSQVTDEQREQSTAAHEAMKNPQE